MPTTPRRSPWPKRLALALVGAVTVVAVGFAALVVAQSAGWVAVAKPTPVAASRKPVAASFGPEALAGPNDAAPEGLGDVVYLLPNDADRKTRLFEEDLPQQLARQGLWLAAREGFGLRVLDADLGDPLPAGLPADRQLRLRGPVAPPPSSPPGLPTWEFAVGPAGAESRVWVGADPGESNDFGRDPAKALAAAEKLSRDLFPRCLAAARFAPKPRPASAAPVPADAALLLGEVRESAQFAAVRRLHAEVGVKGESPALAAALARGYAGLGLLTEHHWGPTAAAYKARALLVSERLSLAAPKSPDAARTRAYVTALAGRHDLALTALTAAAADPAAPPAPAWVETIDAYVHFDAKRLAAPRAAADAPLARLLRFLAAEDPDAPAATLKAAAEFLAAEPECYLVRDAVYHVGGLGNLHAATLDAPKAFADALIARIEAQPGLPATVAAVLAGDEPTEAGVFAALRAAGNPATDRGEPSWAVLGGALRDARFVMAFQRMHFMANIWSVGAGPALAEVADAQRGHPLFALLEGLAIDPRRDPAGHSKALTAAPVGGLDLRAYDYWTALDKSDRAAGSRWHGGAVMLNRSLFRDAARRLRYLGGDSRYSGSQADEFARISPHSALAAALTAGREGPGAAAELVRLEAAYAESPAVQRALSARHLADKRPDDAARCAKRWTVLSPDARAFQALAKVYAAAKDEAHWREALEASLKAEDTGLEHATSRVELANSLMRKGDYKAAEPYALAAAETGAGWAMQCAAECESGLKKWDAADGLYRACADRYDGEAFAWYFACRATGQMDRAAAAAACEAYLGGLPNGVPAAHLYPAARYYQMTNRPREALPLLVQLNAAATGPTVVGGLTAALTADGLGDAAARAAGVAVARSVATADPGYKAVAVLLGGWLAAPGAPDAAAVEAGLTPLPPDARADAELLTGWLLLNRRAGDRAAPHWRRCADGAAGTRALKTHAKVFLDERFGADD